MRRKGVKELTIKIIKQVQSDLLLLEGLAQPEGGVVEVVHCGLDRAAARLHGPVQVLLCDAARAEHVPVRKVLKFRNANSLRY